MSNSREFSPLALSQADETVGLMDVLANGWEFGAVIYQSRYTYAMVSFGTLNFHSSIPHTLLVSLHGLWLSLGECLRDTAGAERQEDATELDE